MSALRYCTRLARRPARSSLGDQRPVGREASPTRTSTKTSSPRRYSPRQCSSRCPHRRCFRSCRSRSCRSWRRSPSPGCRTRGRSSSGRGRTRKGRGIGFPGRRDTTRRRRAVPDAERLAGVVRRGTAGEREPHQHRARGLPHRAGAAHQCAAVRAGLIDGPRVPLAFRANNQSRHEGSMPRIVGATIPCDADWRSSVTAMPRRIQPTPSPWGRAR